MYEVRVYVVAKFVPFSEKTHREEPLLEAKSKRFHLILLGPVGQFPPDKRYSQPNLKF